MEFVCLSVLPLLGWSEVTFGWVVLPPSPPLPGRPRPAPIPFSQSGAVPWSVVWGNVAECDVVVGCVLFGMHFSQSKMHFYLINVG